MKRTMHIEPGYDCRVECRHEPKGDHGIASDIWHYVVSDHVRAMSIGFMCGKYPPSVDFGAMNPVTARILKQGMATALVFHVADNGGTPCEFVAGGLCRSDCTYLGAQEFWAEHGDSTQPEQNEAFWLALEARLPD